MLSQPATSNTPRKRTCSPPPVAAGAELPRLHRLERCFSSSGLGTLLFAYSTARCRAEGSLARGLAGGEAARRCELDAPIRLLSSLTFSRASRCVIRTYTPTQQGDDEVW